MKKIAIITSTRAEYGILKPLIVKLDNEPEFDVRLVVTGTHLLKEYGETYKNIEADGIRICKKIEIPMKNVSGQDISNTQAMAITKFSEYFVQDRPDLVIVLGDRYEIPAFCMAAMNLRIPIAHIAGGETTEGAIDEAYRHAVTKMSWLHFTTTKEYRDRVIQLGENPDRVYNVGSLMIESIKGLEKVSRQSIEDYLHKKLDKPFVLVTFHPVTLENNTAKEQSLALINAMKEFKQYDFICTKANADLGGTIINEMLEEAAKENDNISLYASLGQARYLSLMADAAFLLGNTSSGIGEAPVFKTPTVNIGDRQKGRIRATSIVDCEATKESIVNGMQKVVSKDFLESIKDMECPYGNGDTSTQIVDILKERLSSDIDLKKTFYDIKS